MNNRDSLKKRIDEELSRYGIDLSFLEAKVEIIHKWLEKNCSTPEITINDPYLDVANRAVEYAVLAARDFIQKEIDEKKLNADEMEERWEKVLASFNIRGLKEEEYTDVLIDRHILGEGDNNFFVSEVLDEVEVNSMYA